jgi:uncharacterized membrane protein YfcA
MTGETITGTAPASGAQRRSSATAFTGGAVIGALGGLVGLGGAEFRLPLLIGAFRFAALQAVILNKAMSLVVVASALPFRAAAVPFASVAANWPIIVNLLAGSLAGSMVRCRMGDPARITGPLSCHCRSAPSDRLCAGARA